MVHLFTCTWPIKTIVNLNFFTCVLSGGYLKRKCSINRLVHLCLYPLSRHQPGAVPITSHLEHRRIFFPTSGWLMTRLEAVSGLMKWRVTGLTYLYNHINYVHLSGGPV